MYKSKMWSNGLATILWLWANGLVPIIGIPDFNTQTSGLFWKGTNRLILFLATAMNPALDSIVISNRRDSFNAHVSTLLFSISSNSNRHNCYHSATINISNRIRFNSSISGNHDKIKSNIDASNCVHDRWVGCSHAGKFLKLAVTTRGDRRFIN